MLLVLALCSVNIHCIYRYGDMRLGAAALLQQLWTAYDAQSPAITSELVHSFLQVRKNKKISSKI